MLRRNFLAQVGAGAAWLGLRGAANSFAYTEKKPAAPNPAAKLERIAISSGSLRNYFRGTRASDFHPPGPLLALLDFPAMIADRYQVHHLEIYSPHFPSTELAYLRELKYALIHARSTVVNLPVDIPECGSEGTFSDPDREARLAAVAAVKPWVDVARTLGARSLQVGPGKVDPQNLAPTAASYKALAVYAQARGVRVVVENRPGFGAEHPEELLKLFKLAGPGILGALPDVSSFPDEPTRQKGLKMLFPYAPTVCHAQAREFGAGGAETTYDFATVMAIAKRAGFRGVFAIAFDGPGDPYLGIQKTLDQLLRYL